MVFVMVKQKIAITPNFLDALSKLSKTDQQRVQNTISRLAEEPTSTGLRRHKLGAGSDYISLSSGMDLRILCLSFNDAVVLIYVDHHDDAYKWAESHTVIADENSSFLEIIPTVVQSSPLVVGAEQLMGGKSSGYANELVHRLSSYNLPDELLQAIKVVNTEDALFAFISNISPWLQEIVIDAAANIEQEQQCEVERKSAIAIIQDDDELLKALEYPLQKWRWFLHPMQQRLVDAEANKKTAIIAQPGTGKTITLVHRAVHLDKQQKTVLLLTRSKVLASVLVEMLESISPNHQVYIGYLIDSNDGSVAPNFIIYANQFAPVHTPNFAPVQPKEFAPFLFLLRDNLKHFHGNLSFIDHVLIDEAQDLGKLSHEWINQLVDSDEIGFTISIDFDQAMFSHDVGIINDVLENDGVVKEHLSYSYRLTREILKYAKSKRLQVQPIVKAMKTEIRSPLTKHSVRREKTKSLVALSRQDHSISFYGLAGKETDKATCNITDIDTELARLLSHLRKQYQIDDIAILCQNRFAVYDVPEHLLAKNVLTFSEAKGREWFAGVVIVSNEWLLLLEKQALEPNESNMTAINAFYVALTRFRNQVIVLCIDGDLIRPF